MTETPIHPITPADLTDRERQVAELVARGIITKQIAPRLGIRVRRVQAIIAAIAYKTGAAQGIDDRVHVALWWQRMTRPNRRSA